MKKIIVIMAALFLSVSFMKDVQAKWWIFGAPSETGVRIDYLHLNKTSYSDFDGEAVFFKNSLPSGAIIINGKAESGGRGKIGSVFISLDNKETWKNAKLSQNGTFEYRFRPVMGEIYDFYVKVIDTAGQTNEVDETLVKISLSDKDISDEVRKALNALFLAYTSEDGNQFMSHVSDGFVGGPEVLDSAIRGDFIALDYINVKHYINSIVQSPNGNVYVSFRFNRSVIGTRSGQILTDKGLTEVSFKGEAGQLKLLTMKQPLMFGLSDAEEISTGDIPQSPSDGDNLVINDRGETTIGEDSEDSASDWQGFVTLTSGKGFDFVTDSYCPPRDGLFQPGDCGEIALEANPGQPLQPTFPLVITNVITGTRSYSPLPTMANPGDIFKLNYSHYNGGILTIKLGANPYTSFYYSYAP